MNILIVGGGTAGLACALILQKLTSYKITLMRSPNIPIIGVGEGTTEHWRDFCNLVEIPFPEFFNQGIAKKADGSGRQRER